MKYKMHPKMKAKLDDYKMRKQKPRSLKRVVRALPERTLKRESNKAWKENKRNKQEGFHETSAWYQGYAVAIDWMLRVGKRSNEKGQR